MPAYPEMALHTAPSKKENEVMKAILNGVKNSFNLELAGISLIAYMMKSPTEVMPAYLKIVPY